MRTIASADGTSIAFDHEGNGAPVILLSGAFCDRRTTKLLATALSDEFTTLNVDRRGRGDSGDANTYAVEREIDDIAAVVAAAGGSASLFGHSSGATLALRAAAGGVAITRLLLYEPPFDVDGLRPPLAADLPDRIASLVTEGRRGEAVELYQTEAIGMPQEAVERLRDAPFHAGMEAIAHTLAYDAAIVGDLRLPETDVRNVTIPTLVLAGEHSMPMLRNAAQTLASALPNGSLVTLAGSGHEINPDVTAPAIATYLRS